MTDALTAFDIIVLLMILIAAGFGLMRGFVTEILSLVAWVAGVAALRLFYEPASIAAAEWTGTETGGAILAFVLVFLLTFVAFRFIANALGSRTRQSIVGPLDRLLGFGFGAAKGLIGASLLFLLVTLFFDVAWGSEEPKPEWLQASRTAPLLKVSSGAIVDFVEERRNGGDNDDDAEPAEVDTIKSAPVRKPAGKPSDRDDGYTPAERDALDRLFDGSEGTNI